MVEQKNESIQHDNETKPASHRVATRNFLRKFVPRTFSRRTTSKDELQLPGAECDCASVEPSVCFASEDTLGTCEVEVCLSPQESLDNILDARGYSVASFDALETAYYSKPTALQVASYDAHLLEIARKEGTDVFQAVMKAGISHNARKVDGESLVHTACKKGDVASLKVLLNLGSSVQVVDIEGRTPLHYLCSARRPRLEVAELLISADRFLLHLKDNTGALPLSYLPEKRWAAWNDFFESKKDKFWPCLVESLAEEETPALANLPANSRQLKDPSRALTPELATMVAQGKINSFEAQFLMYDGENDLDFDDDSSCEEEKSNGSVSSNLSFTGILEGLSLRTNLESHSFAKPMSPLSLNINVPSAIVGS